MSLRRFDDGENVSGNVPRIWLARKRARRARFLQFGFSLVFSFPILVFFFRVLVFFFLVLVFRWFFVGFSVDEPYNFP